MLQSLFSSKPQSKQLKLTSLLPKLSRDAPREDRLGFAPTRYAPEVAEAREEREILESAVEVQAAVTGDASAGEAVQLQRAVSDTAPVGRPTIDEEVITLGKRVKDIKRLLDPALAVLPQPADPKRPQPKAPHAAAPGPRGNYVHFLPHEKKLAAKFCATKRACSVRCR